MNEESIILLAQENERRNAPLLQKLSEVADLLQSQYKRTNRSIRIVIDLTEAHTKESLGLEGMNKVFLWLTVERADTSFTFELLETNKMKSSIFTASAGSSLDQHEFTDILITNSATLGSAIIQVGWRD